MSVENMDKVEIEERKKELLARIPLTGSAGNKSLRDGLGWEKELYWSSRNRLVEDAVIELGGGKGGSVKRVPETPTIAVAEESLPTEVNPTETATGVMPTEATVPAAAVAIGAGRETDLYPPLLKSMQSNWAPDHRLEDVIVEITATAGSKATGKWTRPDITMAGYKIFPYVPGKHFDVTVFEIKPDWAVDVTVVYEALAHRRAANRAYALIHVPEHRREALQAAVEEVCVEAKRHGIGVIVAAQPEDYDTWEELAEASRYEPDPERLNDFLAQQLSLGFREQIIKWFR